MTDDRKRKTDDRCVRHDCRRALAESRAEVAQVREAYENRTCDWYAQSDGYDQLRARAERLAEALRVAHRHIDMGALWISHSKDAEQIDAALNLEPNP